MGPAVLATIDLPFKIHNKQPPHPRSQADPYTKFCGLVVSIGRRNSKSRLTGAKTKDSFFYRGREWKRNG